MKDVQPEEEERRNSNFNGEETAQLIKEKQYKLKLKNKPNLLSFFQFIINLLFFLYPSYTFIMDENRKLKRLTNKEMDLHNKLNKSNSSNVKNKSRKLFNLKEEKEYPKKYKDKRLNSFKNYITILIYLIEIISLTKIVLGTYKTHITDSNFSTISLRIVSIGNNSILGSAFNSSYYPNKIYINGEEQPIIIFSYNFNKTINDVELI